MSDGTVPAAAAAPSAAQQNCIFCQIAQGKISAQRVMEDEAFLVVLDINPANPGHCIVLPKTHYQVMPQIPDAQVAHMMGLVRRVSHAILRALKAQGTTIFVANGAIAGQRAPHFMLHVIPRVSEDGIVLDVPKSEYSLQEVKDANGKLAARIAQLFGTPPPAAQTEPPQPQDRAALQQSVPAQPQRVVVDLEREREEAAAPKAVPRQMSARVGQEDAQKARFIWDRPRGMHLRIRGLRSYDVASVTRFFSHHPELVAVVHALAAGPKNAIELQREVDFTMRHLLALEFLGYIRPLDADEDAYRLIAPERTKNHPGRMFYAITSIGRKFLENPAKPLVLQNAVKEQLILEERGEAHPEGTAQPARVAPVSQGPPQQRPPANGNFDLDALTDFLGGK